MDLVTVTYLDDLDLMVRQAKSIAIFLKPCTHWVIINDQENTIKQWYEALSPYYKNHELKLVKFETDEWFKTKDKIIDGKSRGYKLQQVYKLLISKYIKTDYLVLDSKDFFIRKCSLDDFSYLHCSGITEDDSVLWMKKLMIDSYSNYFNIKPPKHVIQSSTPFLVKKKAMDTVHDIEQMLFWFNNTGPFQAEGVFYSLLEYKHGLIDLDSPLKKSKLDSIIYYEFDNTTTFDEDLKNNHVKTISIHRKFWLESDLTTKINYSKMLKRLGIH